MKLRKLARQLAAAAVAGAMTQTICGEKPSHSRIICQKRKSAGSKKAIHYKSEWPQFFHLLRRKSSQTE